LVSIFVSIKIGQQRQEKKSLQTNQLVVGTSSYSCRNIQKDTHLQLDENISKSDYCAMQHPEKGHDNKINLVLGHLI
jgi:hypothetical protein